MVRLIDWLIDWLDIDNFNHPAEIIVEIRSTSCDCIPESVPSHRNVLNNVPAATARLIEAYRSHGHKIAAIDPLGLWTPAKYITHYPHSISISIPFFKMYVRLIAAIICRDAPELNPSLYGYDTADVLVETDGYLGLPAKAPLNDLLSALHETYCQQISVEFQHLWQLEEREWFAQRFEELSRTAVPADLRRRMGTLMLQTQVYIFFHFFSRFFSLVSAFFTTFIHWEKRNVSCLDDLCIFITGVRSFSRQQVSDAQAVWGRRCRRKSHFYGSYSYTGSTE